MKRFFRWFMSIFKKGHQHEPKKPTTVPVPEQATFGAMDIEIHGMVNFTEKEKLKFLEATGLGEQVLNSKQFEAAVLEIEEFVENNGMSNLEIYNLICSGNDLYDKSNDKDIDVFVTMYYNFWTGTIGYTYRGAIKTWINRKFYSQFEIAEILGNVIHEALHNMGFQHLNKATRKMSVPYIIGYIARDLANKHLNGEIVLTPLPRIGLNGTR